jgi:hypothetical protein|eukprot:COSAG01_NODE_3537_length_5961_cov_9.904469_3_plen_65_part_00
MRRAEVCLANRQAEEAIRLLQEALALDPANQRIEQDERIAENKLQAYKLKARGVEELKEHQFAA